MEHTQHLVGNILVEVDGNVAYSESYWQAFHRIAKGKDFSDSGGFVADHDPSIDEDVFVSGRYIDKLEKRDGEWRIITLPINIPAKPHLFPSASKNFDILFKNIQTRIKNIWRK